MFKLNLRTAALFCATNGIMWAPVLLFVGGEYLNMMLAANCIVAAFLLSVLVDSARIRAAAGLVLGGAAVLLLPASPLMYVAAAALAGALLVWSVPFWLQSKPASA